MTVALRRARSRETASWLSPSNRPLPKSSVLGTRCTGRHFKSFMLNFPAQDEVDRSICKPGVVGERRICDCGAEPGARSRKYFPEAAPVAGESRRTDGILDHVHRLRAAVLTYLHHSVGVVDCDPSRFRTVVRGQRIDRAARQRGQRHARICSACWHRACVHGDLSWLNVQVAPAAQERLRSTIFDLATRNPMALFGSDQVIDQFPGRRIYVGKKEGN